MSATNTTNQQLRAACYCRISSDPKDKREGVERQREDTAALCELKGWRIAGIYLDNDKSASNGKKRPEWERLLADIRDGKIDAVAAWDQDRVNRMMDDFIAYKGLFIERGIKLATSNNGDIDLSTPSGVLTATIKTAVSEHEIAMMKIRMRRAARGKAESGRPQWRRAFGYLGDTYQPDPKIAPLVRAAYTQILTGCSLNDICRLFNDAGAFGLTGKKWTPSTVSLFLRKPRNAGLRSHNGEIVGRGTWPALVDESTWKTVQAKLNAPGRKPGKKSVARHLLTGVMLCGREGCDGRLAGNWQMQQHRGGPRAHAITYACRACRRVSIRAEYVEPLLHDLVGGRLAMPDAVDLLKAEVHDAEEAEQIRAELVTLYGELQKIGVERGQRMLTGEQAAIATGIIQQNIDALERKQQSQERLMLLDGIPLGEAQAVDAIKKLSPDRFRAVLNELCTVTIAPVGKGSHTFDPERVHIDWRCDLRHTS